MTLRIRLNTNLRLLIQNCLAVAGMTASGAAVGAMVVIACLRAIFGSDSQHLGILYLAMFLVPVALVVGGIAGACAGMSWVTRNGNRKWGIVTWAGILLGFLLGLTFSSTYFRSDHVTSQFAVVLISATSATTSAGAVRIIQSILPTGRSDTN